MVAAALHQKKQLHRSSLQISHRSTGSGPQDSYVSAEFEHI
jgi:hypothetical protein